MPSPNLMSVPRPAMLVATVMRPASPARAMISASRARCRALSTSCWRPRSPSSAERCSDFSIERVPTSTGRPLEVYEFFRDAGVSFVQFMPIVERLADDAADELGLQLAVGIRSGEAVQAVRMTPWSVEPEAYGEFLCRIFDRWAGRDVGSFVVMNFEWALANYMGRPAGVCQWMPLCGRSPIIEYNGDVYACDHYVYPQYRLGNVLTDDLQEMLQSPAQQRFGHAKLDALPQQCRQCPVGPACWGECPKRRFLTSADGEAGLNYLCAGYKRFFAHAAPVLGALAQRVGGA